MQLKKLRLKIDELDGKILEFINERAKTAIRISSVKKKNNLEVYSAERETYILKRLKALNTGPIRAEDIEIIFREILSVCRSLRKSLHIAYLGPEGTFTHLAATRKFGKKQKYILAFAVLGLLILIGTFLGWFVNFNWLALSALVGAGLLFAGVSGICFMLVIYSLIERNKRENRLTWLQILIYSWRKKNMLQ